MFTAPQLVAHLIGDYILQSHWMATNKTKDYMAAAIHASFYGLPFVFFGPSWQAYSVIVGTHFIIDRFDLAKYVCWFKNGPWHKKTATGYPEDTPVWLAVWLKIITDNTMHIIINGLALTYL